MSAQKNFHALPPIIVAIAVSLGLHLVVLFFPTRPPSEKVLPLLTRLEASLMRRPSAPGVPPAEAPIGSGRAAGRGAQRSALVPGAGGAQCSQDAIAQASAPDAGADFARLAASAHC